MRDTQRQKVYDSEAEAFGEFSETMTLAEAQQLVNRVLASKVIQRRYPRAKYSLTVTDGRRRRRGGYFPRYDESVMAMPRQTRCQWYVLHEVAHHLTFTPANAWHGWEFAACYLKLVEAYVGRWDAEKLKAAFKAKRVRYREPRTRNMTPEQREAARARMLALHAAKAA